MKILFVGILFILSCTDNHKTNFINQKMSIQIEIDPNPSLKEHGFFYYGRIIITNLTKDSIKFSNKSLILKSNSKIESKTNSDSMASHFIDFGYVDIIPNQVLDINVYWVFEEKINVKNILVFYKKNAQQGQGDSLPEFE